jgi:hypothetical protein
MAKPKGIKGERLITIKDEIECNNIVNYLLNNFNLKEQQWTKDEKRNFKVKANKFEVLNDGQTDNWPHGNVLYVSKGL